MSDNGSNNSRGLLLDNNASKGYNITNKSSNGAVTVSIFLKLFFGRRFKLKPKKIFTRDNPDINPMYSIVLKTLI